MSETKFYVELPMEKHGCISMPFAVVEAIWHDRGGPDLFPMTNPDRPVMLACAPAEIAERHPHWYADAFGGWKEVDGPARMLTLKEWQALVAEPDDITCGQADETGEDSTR